MLQGRLMKSLLLSLCLFSSTILANEPLKAELIDTVINAKALSRIEPKYPVSAARNGQEGWVKLSYVIDVEGSVVDPVVEDSSGVKSLEKAAINAIKKWTFDPAKRNGEAIEQCQMQMTLTFLLDNKGGVRKKFARSYGKIMEAIQAKNFASAEEQLSALKKKKLWNMHENSWFWLADSLYAEALNNRDRELASITKASAANKNTFDKDSYLYVLERKFILETSAVMLADALDTFEKISLIDNSEKIVKRLAPYAEKIQIGIQKQQKIIRPAVINEHGNIFHKLTYSSFALSDIKGQLDELEVRCQNKRSRFTVSTDSILSIPKSWGQCSVMVKGDKKAAFYIVELPVKA